MDDDRPAYLIASEAIKHFRNKNYGLAEAVLLDLYGRLVCEYHDQKEKFEGNEPE